MKKKRMLVVDDQELMRTMLAEILRKMGYDDIDEAANGEEAIDMIKRSVLRGRAYDLIFLDVVMPKADGIRVLVECKAYDDTKLIPIVMVSAENERQIVAQAITSGAAAYLLKPYSQKTVMEKVDQLIGVTV